MVTPSNQKNCKYACRPALTRTPNQVPPPQHCLMRASSYKSHECSYAKGYPLCMKSKRGRSCNNREEDPPFVHMCPLRGSLVHQYPAVPRRKRPAPCQRHQMPRPGCSVQACCNADQCNHKSVTTSYTLDIKATDPTPTYGAMPPEDKC